MRWARSCASAMDFVFAEIFAAFWVLSRLHCPPALQGLEMDLGPQYRSHSSLMWFDLARVSERCSLEKHLPVPLRAKELSVAPSGWDWIRYLCPAEKTDADRPQSSAVCQETSAQIVPTQRTR